MMKKNSKAAVIVLVVIAAAIYFVPPFLLPDAEWEGSDDAATEMIYEITGDEYEAWFEPPIESVLGDELTETAENILFIVQGTIGAVVLIFGFLHLNKRRKQKGSKTPA